MATLGRVHDVGTGPQEPNWPSWTALPGRCTGAGWNRWRCRRTTAGQTNAAHVRASISSVKLSLPKQIVRIHLVDLRKCRINVAGRSSCPDRISLANGVVLLESASRRSTKPIRLDRYLRRISLGFQQESVSLTTGVRADRRFSSRSGARSSRTAGTGTQTNALRPKYPRDGGRGDPAEVLADPLQ